MPLVQFRLEYRVRCSHCLASIALHETTLEEIIQRRKVSTTGEPYITFLCLECKGVFRFDYRKRRNLPDGDVWSAGALPRTVPHLSSEVLRCGEDNCESRIELVIYRDSAPTLEQLTEERPNLDGVLCAYGHQIEA
jgi:hypothetical protein